MESPRNCEQWVRRRRRIDEQMDYLIRDGDVLQEMMLPDRPQHNAEAVQEFQTSKPLKSLPATNKINMKVHQPAQSHVGLLSLVQGTRAWGTVGHQAIAYIAQNFVTSTTQQYCQNILGDTSTDYLANVAVWADTYRYTSAGQYITPFHFIDANDDPPSKNCGVDYNRDCGACGCVVSGINNFTSSLISSRDLNSLKFIVHFIGDLHQPLHDENLQKGGNGIDVTFNGKSTYLHHIWDTEMPEQRAGGSSLAVSQQYANDLTAAITAGLYSDDASTWLVGININYPINSTIAWASEANAFVCSTVLNQGLQYIEGTDLAEDYYRAGLPVFELQIAKAGYRLAAWLNLVATGLTGLP